MLALQLFLLKYMEVTVYTEHQKTELNRETAAALAITVSALSLLIGTFIVICLI